MRVRKYLFLNTAAELIAASLGGADPQAGSDPALLETARQGLIQALFDGEVKSEGVLWEIPLPPDQSDPVTQPKVWEGLERGWWSYTPHENLSLTQNVENNNRDEDDETLLRAFHKVFEAAQETNVEQLEDLPQSSINVSEAGVPFEKMTLYWNRNFIEIYDDDGTLWGYGDIRVNSRDLKSCFGVRLADVDTAQRRGDAPKRPSPQKQEEIFQDMLSFPPKTLTRDEICRRMVDKHKIGVKEAFKIFDGRVPRCRKFGRGEKKSRLISKLISK